jgi:hypothetical protein
VLRPAGQRRYGSAVPICSRQLGQPLGHLSEFTLLAAANEAAKIKPEPQATQTRGGNLHSGRIKLLRIIFIWSRIRFMLHGSSRFQPKSDESSLVDQLSRNSTPYQDPLVKIDWTQLDRSSFWLPEDAISLAGVPAFDSASMDQKRALSQFEFLNFVEAGIWLEGLFMNRISRNLLKNPSEPTGAKIYHMHELREETGHSLMFLELLRHSGTLVPNTRFYRLDLANLLARFAPFDSVAFWIAILIGEEVPDRLNRFIRKRREAVNPVVYDIVSIHIMDEARHIAHAKEVLDARLPTLTGWQKKTLSPLINRVFRRFVRSFYFPGPHIYELAGLTPGSEWARLAWKNPQRIKFVNSCVESSLRTLREHGLNLNWR